MKTFYTIRTLTYFVLGGAMVVSKIFGIRRIEKCTKIQNLYCTKSASRHFLVMLFDVLMFPYYYYILGTV